MTCHLCAICTLSKTMQIRTGLLGLVDPCNRPFADSSHKTPNHPALVILDPHSIPSTPTMHDLCLTTDGASYIVLALDSTASSCRVWGPRTVDGALAVCDNLLDLSLLLELGKRSARKGAVDLQTIDKDCDGDETV